MYCTFARTAVTANQPPELTRVGCTVATIFAGGGGAKDGTVGPSPSKRQPDSLVSVMLAEIREPD